MVMAADLSVRMGYLDEAARKRLVDVIVAAHLPIRAPALGESRYIELMRVDKKARAATLRFVVLDGLAKPGRLEGPDPALLAAAYAEVGTR